MKRVRVWVQKLAGRPHLALQWLDPETRRRRTRSAGTADPGEAEAARVDLEADLNHGRHCDVSALSWAAFRERFEEEHASGTRPNSRLAYATTFDLFEQLCRPRRLAAVTERTVSAFAAALRARPGQRQKTAAASTVKARLAFLRAALRWAVAQKLIPTCPRFPEVRVPRKRPQPVPAETWEKLFDKADDPQMRALLLCGWLAGLRLEEAVRLEREPSDREPWVDWPGNRIMLPAEAVKGVEDQWVPLDSALKEALQSLPRQGRRLFYFSSQRTGGRLSAHGVGARVVALARRAGVRLTMRSLRRGFGCRYAGRVPAQVLQRLMRHASITTTVSYYANTDAAAMQAVLGDGCSAERSAAEDTRPKP